MSQARRRWLIAALGAGLPLPYALHLPGNSSSYVAIDLVIWPVVAGALVLVSPKDWRRLWHDTAARLLLAWVVVGALSVPFGVLVYHSLSGLVSYAYLVVILLNFAVGLVALRSVDDVNALIRGFVASLGVVALLLSAYLIYAGALERVHIIHNSPALRAFVYGWPNGFAVLLAVALVMCLYVISTFRRGTFRWFYTVMALGIGACLLLTFSKTGWVALLVALWLLYLRFWRLRYQLLLLGAIASVIVVLSLTNESFNKQIFTLATLSERVSFLLVVLKDVNPLTLVFGSGSQSVETLLAGHAQDQLIPGVTVGSLSTHDEFLNTLVKTGLVGLAIFVAVLVFVMLRNWELTRSKDTDGSRLFKFWYAAGWSVLVSLFAGEQFHYWLLGALFWLMAGASANWLPAAEVAHWRPRKGLKHGLDLVAGILGLIVTSPLLLAAALAIKLGSPGPAIYRGRRVGRDGRIFTMYKLRTMKIGAEVDGSVTVAGDARVTRVGRLLRNLKLDELPQLLNVVKGDMSLVGPRPDTPEYVQLYDDRQRGVLRVRPGITSPASIAFHNEEDLLVAAAADGRRTPAEVYRDVIMPKELDLDLEYVDNWSLRRDFEILMRTAALAARRVGALPRELRHD
jgi:lipopolysaccharide/colanic/teichoic acid biosynthesis glycosyltransferase